MRKLKYLLLTAYLIFAVSFVFPQDSILTIKDLTNPLLYPELVQTTKEMSQLQWMKNQDAFSYVKDNKLFKGVPEIKKKDVLLIDLDYLNKALQKKGLKTLTTFPQMKWVDESGFRFISEDKLLVFDMQNKELHITAKSHASSPNFDLELKKYAFAYTEENNLNIYMEPEGVIPVSKETDKNIIFGQEVSRNEFGITKGTFWSPKSNFLAFYKLDQTMVTDYPVLDLDQKIAKADNIKYPMAGMKSQEIQVGIFNMDTKTIDYVNTELPMDKYLTNVCWSPDEKFLFIILLNRDQNYIKLNEYDVRNGELTKTLIEESNKKYIEPENPIYFLKKQPDKFLWFSKKDGYKHLYLYDLRTGDLIDQINKGNYDVLDFIGYDENEENVLYRAVDEKDPLQKQIYAYNFATKQTIKITPSEGVHYAELSDNGKYLLDIFSSPTTPREIKLIDSKGNIVKSLYQGSNPLKNYKALQIEVSTLKAEDGTDLYYRLIKPADFDPSKKYPVLIYVYGGPHTQLIDKTWMNRTSLWMQYMAEHGYVVFTLDNRGSSNRGINFEQAIFHKISEVEIKDQMVGVQFLKSLPFVDGNRIGVHGWSYGGYLTVAMMLKQPDVFKVGVAGAPVIDWEFYEVMYGERYMGTPQTNEEGYKNANLLNYAKDLKGKLLIIHGTSDETVLWQHTLKFLHECIKNGIQLDYFVYPGQKHGISGASNRNHLNEKITNYFRDNL